MVFLDLREQLLEIDLINPEETRRDGGKKLLTFNTRILQGTSFFLSSASISC